MRYDLHEAYGERTHVITHDGVSDAVRDCRELVGRGGHYPYNELHSESFIGRKFDNWDGVVAAVEKPWEEGLKTVEGMVEKLRSVDLPSPVTVRRRQVWRDADGDFDLDRCMEGREAWRGTTKGVAGGPRTISLLVQTDGNSSVRWQDLMWRSAACVAMALILEEAGYSVEITAFVHASHSYNNGDHALGVCKAKEAGDPLNLSSLINALSGWYFRTVGMVSINLAHAHAKHLSTCYSFGSHREASAEMLPYLTPDPSAAWRVVDVWTEGAAVSLARRLLGTLSVESATC